VFKAWLFDLPKIYELSALLTKYIQANCFVNTALQNLVVTLTGIDNAIQILGYVNVHLKRGHRTAPETGPIGQVKTLDGNAILPPANLRRWITRAGVTDQLGSNARH